MDKETLSNYGWIVICVLVLAVMIALATPFGDFVAGAVKSTTQGLFDTENKAITLAGVATGLPDPALNPSDTIPEGATYSLADGSVVSDGGEFPETVNIGDAYVYGDYEYRYNQWCSGAKWYTNEAQNGWGVRVLDANKTTYGAILESINDIPVTSLQATFENCTSLIKAPTIPSGVTRMYDTFRRCTSLTDEGLPIIPEGVTNLVGTFHSCTSITKAPEIPNSVTDMCGTFNNCTSLTDEGLPIIPNGVTNMSLTFYSCTSLTKAPEIPNSVTNMSSTFSQCTSLTDEGLPIIPNGVTNMTRTFYNCTSLTKAPEIPNSVMNMQSTFEGCTSLITAPAIPNSVTTLHSTFRGCTSLTTAPIIPSNVTNIQSTFEGCSSLTGTITVHTNPEEWTRCLSGTQITSVVGNTKKASNILKTRTSNKFNP